jgi:RNA polymerase sigma-70 factor (ECF subfamily)
MFLSSESTGGQTPPLEGGLVQRLRSGDTGAFAQIYDLYSRIIFGLVLRMVRNPALAEDLQQEIFLKLWRSAGSLDETVTSLGPWLIAVARHHVLDYLKSGQNRRAMQSAGLTIDDLSNKLSLPEHDFVFEERVQTLQSGLGCLDEKQRKIVELAYFEGLTQTEIASVLKMPLGTVKSCVRLALRNLKKQLKKEDPES